MFSTRKVRIVLRESNPDKEVTEDQIRHVLRRGAITPPQTFAGRLAWTTEDVAALAEQLRLDFDPETPGVEPLIASPEVERQPRHESDADPVKGTR